MSAQTDGSLVDDEVIEILRQVRHGSLPTSTPQLEELLAKGRRSRRRHRLVVAQMSSLAIIGLAVSVFAIGHVRSSEQQVFIAPAALSAESSVAPAQSNWQVLQEALGDDFIVNSETGEISVKPGSASGSGLPDGLRLGAQIFAMQQSPQSGEITTFCKPLVEKNVIFSACTTRTLQDGKTVYIQLNRTGPGGAGGGRSGEDLAADGVRVLFEQTDGDMVIVDLGTQEPEANSSPARRAQAQSWLQEMTPRLTTAAVDPRVQEPDARSGSKGATKPRASVTKSP